MFWIFKRKKEEPQYCEHEWELIATTEADPVSMSVGTVDLGEVDPVALLGCTELLWECTECGVIRNHRMCGRQPNEIDETLKLVDEYGRAGYTRNNKRYIIVTPPDNQPQQQPVNQQPAEGGSNLPLR